MAYVRVAGQQVYLRPWGSPEAGTEYARRGPLPQ